MKSVWQQTVRNWAEAIRVRRTAFGVLVLVLAASLGLMLQNATSSPVYLPTTKVIIGKTVVLAEIADEPKERAQGLSGRKSLSPGQGMLFLFEQPDRPGFWMKEMNFALDFIWIFNGRVAEISENIAPPSSGRQPIPFYPDQPIDAVLEVPAGYAKSQGWQAGTVVTLGR